jgi:hypothetical protein
MYCQIRYMVESSHYPPHSIALKLITRQEDNTITQGYLSIVLLNMLSSAWR